MALRPVLAVLVVLLVAAVGFAAKTRASADTRGFTRDLPCPNEVDILPCTCHTNVLLDMIMDCSLVKTSKELERVFNATFPFNEFYELIIEHDPSNDNYQLTELKSDIFHRLTFERVIITGTKLEVIEESVFSYSYDTLKQLNLQDNKINDFPFESMTLYVNLEILLLDNNQLPTLEKFISNSLKTLSMGYNANLAFTWDVFEKMPNLVNLNLERINLKDIPQHIFRNLTQLVFLNFNNNDLVELEEYTFDSESRSLARLLLANNRIYKILPNAIDGITAEAIIDMSNNRIETLTRLIWQPIMDQMLGGILDLTGNPLVCGCDMSWLFLDTSSVNPSQVYLPIITDHTTCYDGTQVKFLDYHVFQKHCT
ncbi:oplophorus-luciferin 2-monooxygenase non-catalytic subunit-like isoform X3 [Eriocheir sinensis]|uniref:oplophorus-luciferin 2-monooxygenase non-catalytic subunit-like isoform X3 n=1 Tax=Eriocheir sinensis TaxID=95602 RepID=UPI0021C8DDEF|nr:oplophorus-luciferin 2-monooxygenase non-catalytic subunit-like isoform X3 [Eriocheir sinensis]